jgi:K+-transporting ATPase ATPase A chain
MTTELIGIIAIYLVTILLAWPLGRYIARVFSEERVWTDFMKPIEDRLLRLAGVRPEEPMDWRANAKALLALNAGFFVIAFLLLSIQGLHPFWNPNGFANWEPGLAFNTAVSFTTNTNLQHYSGETGASYFSQLLVFCWLQFVSAATGIAAMALLLRGLKNRSAANLGNFWTLFLKSNTRILLPLAILVAIILVFRGTPVHFGGLEEVVSLEGAVQKVATGPVAPMVAIKQIGTNGGGFFGPNSSHPFENPDYLTNAVENIAILLIPIALVFTFGIYLNRKKLAVIFFGVMTALFIAFCAVSAGQEWEGNAGLEKLGLSQQPNMEGKETRFGPIASAFWGVSTTSTSNGSVNSMHDSHTPLSGGVFMIDMMVNAVYGGVGVGFINFFLYVVIAVFIAGLMIGRTPEFLGKKIEAAEVKVATLVVILHPFLILTGTAIAAFAAHNDPELAAAWLKSPSFHGFSEMAYEFTSASANNGSGFEGLGDNTLFWNISTGLVMLLARFLPIVGPLAIAGMLGMKKPSPESAGTLKLESAAFSAVLLGVILVVAALSFFPMLALGPIAEFLSSIN